MKRPSSALQKLMRRQARSLTSSDLRQIEAAFQLERPDGAEIGLELRQLAHAVRRIGTGFHSDPETIAGAKDEIARHLDELALSEGAAGAAMSDVPVDLQAEVSVEQGEVLLASVLASGGGAREDQCFGGADSGPDSEGGGRMIDPDRRISLLSSVR